MTLALEPESDEGEFFGYTGAELQTDLVISHDEFTGTLNYVDGSKWDGAGWSSDEEAGNFVAFKVTGAPEDATITIEIEGGDHGPVTLDADRNIVCRIKNTTQKIKVVAIDSTEHYTVRKTYSLRNLTLETGT